MSTQHFSFTIAAASSILLLSGCVISPDPYTPNGYETYPPVTQSQSTQTNGRYTYDQVIVPNAPPAPVEETIPVAPFVGALWIAGFWDLLGGQYVWTPGHYISPRIAPRHGYIYQPAVWQHTHGGYRLTRGYWRR